MRNDPSVAASGGSRRSPDAGAGVRGPEVDSLLEQFQEGFGGERGDRLAPDVHHWAQHEGALPGVEELSVAESVGAAVVSIGVTFGRHEAAAELVYPPGEAVIDPLVDEVGRVQLRVIARVGDHDAAGQDHRVALDWLACGHSFPQVDPEPDSASGQAEARRRDETRPGGPALFGRCVWFNGPQVAERIVDDLAQVCLGLGDLLAARILGGLGRRLVGGGAGLLGSMGSKAARWIPGPGRGLPAPAAAGPARRGRPVGGLPGAWR